MKSLIPLAIAVFLLPGLVRAQERVFDNSPVSSLDLSRYLGTWYEIARFDHSFERGMDNVTAEYILLEDGRIKVINSGWRNGKYNVTEGKARWPEPLSNPAHLEVSFFLFFYSDYNVLMIDEDYQVALVGSGSPKYLWILSRTPSVSDEMLDSVLEDAERRGYDTSRLIWVEQNNALSSTL